MRRRRAPSSSDSAVQPYLWVPLHFSTIRTLLQAALQVKRVVAGRNPFFFWKLLNMCCASSCAAHEIRLYWFHTHAVYKRGHARWLPFFPPTALRSFLPANTLRKPRTMLSANLPGHDACLSLDRMFWRCNDGCVLTNLMFDSSFQRARGKGRKFKSLGGI